MKPTKNSLTICIGTLAALLLACCSQDGMPPGTGGTTHGPLVVSTVSVAGGDENVNTRGAALPTPVTEGRLWVGIRAKNGYAARTGLIYTYSGGAWTSATVVPLGNDPVSLYAYWPQDEYPESGGMVTLTTQPYSAGKDLGYALSGGENVCSVHPSAGFVLNHAYARIKVNITFSPYFLDDVTLDDVFVSAEGLCLKGTLILESGILIPGATLQKLVWPTSGQTMAATSRVYAGDDILVVPSSSLTDTMLVITLDGADYCADLGSALTELEAGKSYRINAEVKAEPAVVISRVEVEDWTTGTSHSGDAEFQ